MMRCLTTLTILALGLAASAAEAPETVPADVAAVLEKTDAAGRTLETLTAHFDYELNQTLYEDIQKRKGRLAFKAPNLLRFEFTTAPQETFVFDGRRLYHKKDATKQLVVWELRGEDEPPVESFELGKTPFPMPFGQKKGAVLKFFDVRRDAEAEAADAKKRWVLELVPKKGTDAAADYTKIALWIEKDTGLPTRTRLGDPSENITTLDFHHIEPNAKVDPTQFARPDVPDDWEQIVHAKEPTTKGR